jgi:hypothetical protein
MISTESISSLSVLNFIESEACCFEIIKRKTYDLSFGKRWYWIRIVDLLWWHDSKWFRKFFVKNLVEEHHSIKISVSFPDTAGVITCAEEFTLICNLMIKVSYPDFNLCSVAFAHNFIPWVDFKHVNNKLFIESLSNWGSLLHFFRFYNRKFTKRCIKNFFKKIVKSWSVFKQNIE